VVQIDSKQVRYSCPKLELSLPIPLLCRPFEDLTSDEARNLFNNTFVPDFNDGKLPLMFYEGIPFEIREAATKTTHK
jgi:hypothetical protein